MSPLRVNVSYLFCRLFDEFVDCIIDTMAGDNLICNHDNLKRHMIDKNILSDWSEGFYWNYYDNCEGKLICNSDPV